MLLAIVVRRALNSRINILWLTSHNYSEDKQRKNVNDSDGILLHPLKALQVSFLISQGDILGSSLTESRWTLLFSSLPCFLLL